MIKVNFRELSNYAQSGAELSRQISHLEDNVAKALTELGDAADPTLTPTNLKTSAYSAMLGDLVIASGSFIVTLPIASPQNAGAFIGIVVTGAGTISVASASGLVQGVATDTLSTTGLFLFESNGVGWWRSPGMVSSVTAGTGLTGGGTGDVTLALDTTTAVTSAALNAAVQLVRMEAEQIRVLLMQLVKLELGDALDLGVELTNGRT